MPFRILPHTADLRAALDAPDAEGLAVAAVELVRQVLVGESVVAGAESRVIARDGEGEAEQFFRFVRELFFLNDAEGFLPAAVEGAGPWTLRGERFDPARHVVEHQVKALTRHGYRYNSAPDGCHAELILDL